MNTLFNTANLPESVLQIADIIGLSATEKLVRAIGGTRFKFGKGRHDTARLKILQHTIGKEKTEQLLAVFGGDTLYIPRCQIALQRLRNQRFRADFAALTNDGETSKAMALLQLCPQYGISNRTADKILQECDRTAMQQGNLF